MKRRFTAEEEMKFQELINQIIAARRIALEANGFEPDSMIVASALAEKFGMKTGDEIAGVRIVVYPTPEAASVPDVPWYRDHWELIALGFLTIFITFMTYCGPAQRPDCIPPEPPILMGIEAYDDD